jgi:hypothetical protein
MISHYYTKQGEGAGMQRLSFPSNDAFFDERDQKKYLTSKELTAISNRIDEGETLPSIAREIGMYYCELRSQLKDNGYSYNNFKRCAKPPPRGHAGVCRVAGKKWSAAKPISKQDEKRALFVPHEWQYAIHQAGRWQGPAGLRIPPSLFRVLQGAGT